MGVVSAKHLTEALQQAKAVGLVEEKFKVGDIFEVTGHWRGGFHLSFVPKDGKMSRRGIRNLQKCYVELLDE